MANKNWFDRFISSPEFEDVASYMMGGPMGIAGNRIGRAEMESRAKRPSIVLTAAERARLKAAGIDPDNAQAQMNAPLGEAAVPAAKKLARRPIISQLRNQPKKQAPQTVQQGQLDIKLQTNRNRLADELIKKTPNPSADQIFALHPKYSRSGGMKGLEPQPSTTPSELRNPERQPRQPRTVYERMQSLVSKQSKGKLRPDSMEDPDFQAFFRDYGNYKKAANALRKGEDPSRYWERIDKNFEQNIRPTLQYEKDLNPGGVMGGKGLYRDKYTRPWFFKSYDEGWPQFMDPRDYRNALNQAMTDQAGYLYPRQVHEGTIPNYTHVRNTPDGPAFGSVQPFAEDAIMMGQKGMSPQRLTGNVTDPRILDSAASAALGNRYMFANFDDHASNVLFGRHPFDSRKDKPQVLPIDPTYGRPEIGSGSGAGATSSGKRYAEWIAHDINNYSRNLTNDELSRLYQTMLERGGALAGRNTKKFEESTLNQIEKQLENWRPIEASDVARFGPPQPGMALPHNLKNYAKNELSRLFGTGETLQDVSQGITGANDIARKFMHSAPQDASGNRINLGFRDVLTDQDVLKAFTALYTNPFGGKKSSNIRKLYRNITENAIQNAEYAASFRPTPQGMTSVKEFKKWFEDEMKRMQNLKKRR